MGQQLPLFYSYCQLQGLAPRTIRAIKGALALLVRSHPDLLGVTTEEVMRFFVHGRTYGFASDQPAGPSHYNNIHKYLNKFFKWAVLFGYRPDNPIERVPRCKTPKSLPRRLSSEQVLKVLYHANHYRHPSRYLRARNHALIAILLMTGLRAREVLNLRNEDISLRDLSLRVRAGKGNKDRDVYFNTDLCYILKDYQAQRDRLRKTSAFLFVSFASNHSLRYKNLRDVVHRVSQAAGVYFTAHMLRHTCFSMLAEQNVSIAAIQAQAGHSSIVTTQMYIRVSEESRSREVRKASFLIR